MKWTRRTDRLLVCAALVSGTLLTTVLLVRALSPTPLVIEVGRAFPHVEGLSLTDTPALILFVSSECDACTQSGAFYARLTAEPSRRRIVIIGSEPVDRLKGFVALHGIAPDQILSIGSRPINLAITPVIVAVDAKQLTVAVWNGRLMESAQEASVLKTAVSW